MAIERERDQGHDDKPSDARLNKLHGLLRDAIGESYPSIDDASRDCLWAYLDELLAAALTPFSAGSRPVIDEPTAMLLAAISTACAQNTRNTAKQRIYKGNPYWTQAYGDVCDAVDREMKYRERADELQRTVGERDVTIANLTAAINAMNETPQSASVPFPEEPALGVTALMMSEFNLTRDQARTYYNTMRALSRPQPENATHSPADSRGSHG